MASEVREDPAANPERSNLASVRPCKAVRAPTHDDTIHDTLLDGEGLDNRNADFCMQNVAENQRVRLSQLCFQLRL